MLAVLLMLITQHILCKLLVNFPYFVALLDIFVEDIGIFLEAGRQNGIIRCVLRIR